MIRGKSGGNASTQRQSPLRQRLTSLHPPQTEARPNPLQRSVDRRVRPVNRIPIESPARNRRRLRGLLPIDGPSPRRADQFDVVPQLSAKADRPHMVVILPITRLMTHTRVEGLGLPVKGIPKPDAVALLWLRKQQEGKK